MSFEVKHSDLAGRIGKLETAHGTLETPVFIPVVHPVRQTISPKFLKKLGFNGLITNAYTTLKYYGDDARAKGIHDILNYDGVIMTDSGGYQILEYGTIDAEPRVISQFERDIGSDISVPLDKPTGYGLKYEIAKEYVEQTLVNAKNILVQVEEKNVGSRDNNQNGSTIWVGPVQGAEHLDLVRYSANALDKMGFEVLAIGSPVQIMEAYEFSVLAKMIATVKRTVHTKPIHLFGAGHPLTIPLAVSLGCDMFDSASYMLYARDERYMHPNGTVKFENLSYLSCQCPVCCSHTVKEFREMIKDDRIEEIAKHNLYVLRAEVNAVKQAIVDGRLWEYVMLKARAHPKLMKAMDLFRNFEFLEDGTPLFKEKALFLYEPIDQYRPEAVRFRRIASMFRELVKKDLVLYPTMELQPFYSTRDFVNLVKKFPGAQICVYNQFLGVIPVEICDIFPAAHYLSLADTATPHQAKDYPSFLESLNNFLAHNSFENITIIANDFMHDLLYNNKHKCKFNARIFDFKEGLIFEL